MRRYLTLLTVFLSFALVLSACDEGGSSGQAFHRHKHTPTPTASASEVATPTATPTLTATATATRTSSPSSTSTRTQTATPTSAATCTVSVTGSLNVGRAGHTATLFTSGPLMGEVLVAGGNGHGAAASLASAELYDPVAGTWSLTGSMITGRVSHTATLLPNGMVLVAGGSDPSGLSIATAELYNPATGTWTATGSLTHARANHTATLTPNGVLMAGGVDGPSGIALVPIAELYDLTLGTFSDVGALSNPRQVHTSVLFTAGPLANDVLLIGGVTGSFNYVDPTDLFTPVGNTFSASGSLIEPRYLHTSTLLTSGANAGKVLVEGGTTMSASGPDKTTEIFDPATATFSAGPDMVNDHAAHTATLFTSGSLTGQVLIAAGAANGGFLSTNDELYDPVANSFSATCSLIQARESHTATLLLNGNVLIAGGFIVGGGISECELYTP